MIVRVSLGWTHPMPQHSAVTSPAMGGFRGNGRKANLQELIL
jgi:hypothetical protein